MFEDCSHFNYNIPYSVLDESSWSSLSSLCLDVYASLTIWELLKYSLTKGNFMVIVLFFPFGIPTVEIPICSAASHELTDCLDALNSFLFVVRLGSFKRYVLKFTTLSSASSSLVY